MKILATVLLCLVLVPSAFAQRGRERDHDRWRRVEHRPLITIDIGRQRNYRRQYTFDREDSARSQGYRDGFRTGSDDWRHNRSFDPGRSHYYRESGYGNFALEYREAFVRGYEQGYQ